VRFLRPRPDSSILSLLNPRRPSSTSSRQVRLRGGPDANTAELAAITPGLGFRPPGRTAGH
jgi:hypothetical protein